MKIISLGAGVQSTTLALLAHHKEIEPPDYAVFADTGWEPKAVYKHLDWLELFKFSSGQSYSREFERDFINRF